MKRYRLSYRQGVIEDTGEHLRPADASLPMYLATEVDAEIARLQSQLDHERQHSGAVERRLTEVLEMLAAAEADAKRYRWLRNKGLTWNGDDTNKFYLGDEIADYEIDAAIYASLPPTGDER